MHYLNQISWPNDHSIVDVSTRALFRGVKLDQYQFNGNIDVILLDNGNAESKNYADNIRLGIEIKKIVQDKNHNQACIEHLCASSLNHCESVLTLLTDLKENWFFLYFGLHAKLYKMRAHPSEAKFLLENMFNHENLPESHFPKGFVDRLSWNDFVKSSAQFWSNTCFQKHHSSDRDNHQGQDEDDSTNPKKQARYTEKNSSDGRNDTAEFRGGTGHSAMLHFGGEAANELDLLDFVDNEEERMQIVINYVVQNVAPMFTFSTSLCDDETLWSPSSSSSSSSLAFLGSSTIASSLQHQHKSKDNSEMSISFCNNGVVPLSDHNLLRHNMALRD
jgi:hypothetical protein